MFKYTKAALDLTVKEIKKFYHIFKFSSLLISIAYFIFCIISKTGILWINIAVIALSFAYLIFSIITLKVEINKKVKKAGKRIYAWSKLLVKLISLAATIYGIYEMAVNEINALSIVLVTLMIILWVLQVLLEIIIEVMEHKLELFKSAFEKDIYGAMEVKRKAGNIIRRLKGDEPVEEEIKYRQKDIDYLDKYIDKNKK